MIQLDLVYMPQVKRSLCNFKMQKLFYVVITQLQSNDK